MRVTIELVSPEHRLFGVDEFGFVYPDRGAREWVVHLGCFEVTIRRERKYSPEEAHQLREAKAIWSRMSDRMIEAFGVAHEAAIELGAYEIDTEHLLMGLLRTENNAVQILDRLGVTADQLRRALPEPRESGNGCSWGALPTSSRTMQVFSYALKAAAQYQQDHIHPEHVLLGLLQIQEGVASQALTAVGIDAAALKREVRTAR